MWRKPIWCYRYYMKDNMTSLPIIEQFGYGQAWTTEYYNSAEVRNDEPHHLFQFTLEGEGHFKDKNGIHKITPGKGFLCNPLDKECSYYFPEGAYEKWKFLFVVMQGGDEIINELKEKYGPIFTLSSKERLLSKLHPTEQIEPYSFITKEMSLAENIGYITELLQTLIKSAAMTKSKNDSDHLIQKAKLVIKDNSKKGLSVEEVASSIGISPEHLSRIFKKETGMGPHHYIVEEKVKLAKYLLTNSHLRIKEIATRSGFDSARDFNRTFKKKVSMTPGEFRKES